MKSIIAISRDPTLRLMTASVKDYEYPLSRDDWRPDTPIVWIEKMRGELRRGTP